MASETVRLNKIIRPAGYELRRHKRHGGIHRISDGKRVLTCSGTASDNYWWKNVIRDLVKYGHVTDKVMKETLKLRSR